MAKSRIEGLKAAMYWLSVNYQQNYYELSSDWNKYMPDELKYLKKYIGYALYGPPDFEEILGDEKDDCNYVYKEKGAMALIDTIYGKIVEHGTQSTEEKEVLCSILYTCIYDEDALSKCNEDKLHEIIYVKPIFKIQKNIKTKKDIQLQIWYVDTEARVYKSWTNYLNNNNLPTCVMIAPKDGIYQADLKEVWSENESTVWVQVHNNNKSKKIIRAVDTTSTIVNIGCVGIGIAAMFNPISAPIAIAGFVGGTASGFWGGGRALSELVDRGRHDQSVSPINRHALPAWLGVAGNTLGLAASGGSALLSRAVRTGTTVTKSAQIAHDAILISNLVVNISGVGFNSVNMYQKYKETGEVSAKDVFFLTAHVLFVCNSVVQMRVASDIIKSNSEQVIKDYEMSLRSKKHQKAFRTLVRNTRNAATSKAQGNEEIIRGIKNIKNKDDFFAAVSRSRKLFNTQGVQLSFIDGQLSVDGVKMISPSSFASMGKDNIVTLINQATGSNIQASGSNSFFRTGDISSNLLKTGIATLKTFYVNKSVEASEPLEKRSKDYEEVISDLGENPDKTKILNFLLESGLSIVKLIGDPHYSVDHLLSEAVNFLWRYIKTTFVCSIPGASMFEDQCREKLFKIVKFTYDYIKSNSSEWVSAFRLYMKSLDSENTLKCNNESESNLTKKSRKDLPIKYNDMVILDPLEVMSLPQEIVLSIIEEALFSTGSKMNDTSKLSAELIKICEEEFNDFFFKHPTEYNFKVSELSDELKGILLDLAEFNKKNIIFYKLIVISINIALSSLDDRVLIKKDIVDIMKGLWIFVCMNFREIAPDTYMMEKDYESFIINIIIAIYDYQTENPNKWSSAFKEYKGKFSNP